MIIVLYGDYALHILLQTLWYVGAVIIYDRIFRLLMDCLPRVCSLHRTCGSKMLIHDFICILAKKKTENSQNGKF
jgi:hypothetical protein